ncbi:PX-domain-containing protein [Hesseltinella vesiculosa]|uniref:PX-domain-containing protein n=1 Tax=Hesseltinella vesiculosa TaxID=101127 RepID=A0A1X2GQ91_9FUNG|nr:PX-domain-containing protein [Hesseltinella vesiculosa]
MISDVDGTGCTCDIAPPITIPHAEQKTSDKQTFWLYIIHVQNTSTKRRYSEFESFRSVLVKLHPSIFVPPIPGKHSLSDYAHVHSQSRFKDEQALIEKRKRMLQRFLQRILDHPVLSREHVFHQFLQPHIVWQQDLLSRPPLDSLKNPFAMDSMIASLPGSSYLLRNRPYALKHPDPAYIQCETLLNDQLSHSTRRWEHTQKKLLRRLGDLANDHAELGAAYNGLSLDETKVMGQPIERLGLQHDATCLTLRDLVTQLECEFAEHVQEYVQYILIARQSIEYWHMTLTQLELIGDALISKQTAMHTLLKTEGQAERLEQQHDTPHLPADQAQDGDRDSLDIDTHSIEDGFFAIDSPTASDNAAALSMEDDKEYPREASASAIRASRSRSKKWTSPRKLLNAMSYTLHGMMDIDPGLTRRNQIGKLKEEIEQLERAKIETQHNLKQIDANIQSELARFEKQRAKELKAMLVAFAKYHMQFCETNMEHWITNKKKLEQFMTESRLSNGNV